MEKIITNKIKCLLCGDIVESKSEYDIKWCSCGNCFADGGHYFLRRGWKQEDSWEELSITEETSVI